MRSRKLGVDVAVGMHNGTVRQAHQKEDRWHSQEVHAAIDLVCHRDFFVDGGSLDWRYLLGIENFNLLTGGLVKKGVPRRDGSGGGVRRNQGRGGCPPAKQQKRGKGTNRRRNT